jgi:hypothetical protein
MSNTLAKSLLGVAALAVLFAPAMQRSRIRRPVGTTASASATRLCVVHEFMHGASAGRRRRAEAESAAVRDWRRNVIETFGERYSDIRLASNVYGRCWRDSYGRWGCTTQARPCAPGRDVSASIRKPR